jgi:hypothetical protein
MRFDSSLREEAQCFAGVGAFAHTENLNFH